MKISSPNNKFTWLLFVTLLTACWTMFESPPIVKEVALGDLDGDGDLDAVLANGRFGEPYSYPTEINYQILYNDGTGVFNSSSRIPDVWNHNFVALGQFNGDGALDAVFGPGYVRFNNGRGELVGKGSLNTNVMLSGFRGGTAVGDLNNDGNEDIFIANCCGGVSFGGAGHSPSLLVPHNLVFLNDGGGRFTHNGQLLGNWGSHDVALGDLNGDGALDAFVVNGQTQVSPSGPGVHETPNTVWFNDGSGLFTDSGQQLGLRESYAVALGDVDGDSFLDAVVGNDGEDEVWLNDGLGNFTESGQRLDNDVTRAIFLADLDGDGDLDLVTAGETAAHVWLNDGSGRFSQNGERMRYKEVEAITFGDLEQDGDQDVLVAGINEYTVWFNDGNAEFKK
jgi:hypothetical protein